MSTTCLHCEVYLWFPVNKGILFDCAGETTMPDSVEDWLHSLRLAEYLDIFKSNHFTTMDRVRNIWELELNTVSRTLYC